MSTGDYTYTRSEKLRVRDSHHRMPQAGDAHLECGAMLSANRTGLPGFPPRNGSRNADKDLCPSRRFPAASQEVRGRVGTVVGGNGPAHRDLSSHHQALERRRGKAQPAASASAAGPGGLDGAGVYLHRLESPARQAPRRVLRPMGGGGCRSETAANSCSFTKSSRTAESEALANLTRAS